MKLAFILYFILRIKPFDTRSQFHISSKTLRRKDKDKGTSMSYARVNDASDSEDEASNNAKPSTSIHSPPPPPRTRQAGSVAAAALAALTRGGNSNRQGYTRLDEEDNDRGGSPMQEQIGAGVVDRRQEVEQSHELSSQSQRQSQDQLVQRSRTEENADLEINIRFGEGQDLSLRVLRTDTIAQVKDKVGLAEQCSMSDVQLLLPNFTNERNTYTFFPFNSCC